ncbi:MAG: hypothetical protein HYZ66_07250 [Chlamydiae bacterium]|nr:hypothetical protein [Chlamydiota bacterium]
MNIHWREGPYELKGVKLPAFGYLERNKGRANVRGTIHLYLSSDYPEEGFLHEVLEHIILRTSSRPEISGKGLRANSKEAKTAASRRHTSSAVYEGILGDYWQLSRRAVGQIQGMTPQERRQFKDRYYSEVVPGIHSKFPRAQFPHSNEWVSHYASEVNGFAGRFEGFLKNWGEEGAKRESFLDQCQALKIAPGKVISWLNTALKLKGYKTQFSAFYLFDVLERQYSRLIPEYAALLDKVFEESVSLRVKYHVFDLLWNAALQDSENRKELLKIISEILDRRDEDYILVAFEALSSLLSYRNYSYFSRKLEFFSELLALQDVEISIYVFRALSKLPQNAMSNSEETPALFKSLLEIPDKQRQKEGFSLLSQLLKDSRFSIEEWPSFVTLIKLLLEEKNARLLHLLASWLDALVKIEDIDQSHYARKWLRQVLLQAPKPEDLFPERTWQRGRSLSALEEAACYWMEQEFGMKEEDILALLNDPEIKKICPVFFFSALETMDIVDKGGVVSPSISEQEAKDILRRVLQTKADPRMVPRIMKYFLQDPRKREASEVVFRGVDLSLYLSTDVEREIRNEELPDYQATLLESAVLYHDLILKRREALKESLGSYEAADQAMVVVANLTNGWFPLAALTEGRVDGNTYILGTNIQVIQTKIGSSEIENVGFTGYFDDVFSGEEKSKIGRARQVIVVDVSLESMESPADFPNKFHYPSAFVGYLCYLMKSRGIAIPQSWNARFANSLGLLRRQGTEVKFWYPRAWYPVEHSAPLMGEFKGPYEPVPQGYDISNETGEPRLGTQGQEWVFCHAALPRKTNIDRLHLGEYALQGKRWDDKGKEREGTLVAQGSNGGWKLQTSWRLTNGLRGLWNDFIEGETFKGIFRDHSSFPRQATSTKNQIHLLALDLDGTLTSPEKTPLTSATVEKLVNILWSHSDLSLMIATMQGMDELRRTVIQPLEERMRGWTQHQRDYILNRIGLFPCGSAQGYLWEEENWAKKYDKAEEQEIDFGRLAQVLGDSVHNRGASLEAYGSGGRLVEELKQNPESEIRAMAEKLEVSEDGWHIVPKGITKAVGRDFMMSKRGIVPGQVMAMGNNPRMSLDGDPWMQPLGGCFREVHSPDETLAVLDRFFPAPNSGDTVLNSATSEAGMAPFMSLVLDWFGIPREKQAGYEQVGYLAAFIIIVASIVASTPLLMQGFLGMMGVAGVFILIHPLSYFVIRIFEKLLGHPLMPQGPPLKGMVPPPAVLSEAGSPSANWPVGPTAGGGMVLGATKAALANTISLIPAYLLYFYMNSYPALAIVALLFYIPASRYHHEMNLEYLKNEGLENYDATAARRFSTMASLFSSTLNSSKLTLTFKSFLISLTSDSIRELLSSSFAVLASIRAVLTSIRALLSRSWRTDASNLAVLSSSLLILPSILVNLSLVSYRKLSRLLESASNLFSDFSDSSSTLLRRATTFSPTALNWLRISSIRTALYRCISSVGRDFGDFFSFMEKMLELAQNSVKGFRIINNISLRFSRASLKPILKSLLLLPFAVKLIEMVLDYGTASAAEMGHVAVAEAAGTGVAGFVGVMLVLLVAFTIYVNARVGDAWFGIGQWQTTLQLQQSSTQLSLRQPWLQSPFGQISIPTIKKVNADTLKAMLIHTDILRKNSLAKMAAIITFVMSMIVFASNSLRALVKTLISLIAHTIIQLRMTVQGNSFTRSKSTQTSSLAFLTRIQQVEPEFLAPPEVNPLLNELIEQVMKEDVDDALKKRMKRAILRMGLSSITFGQFMDELEGIVRVRSRGETEPIDEKAIPEMVAGEAETLFLFAANVLKVGSVPFEVIEGLVRAYQSGLDYDGIAIFDLRVITLDDLVARLSHGFILPKGGDATLSLRVQEGMKESRLSLEIASLSLAMTNAKRGILTVNADGGLLVSGKAIEIFPREQSQLKALYQVVGNQTEPLSIDLSRVHPQRVDQILKSIFSNQEALREGLSIEGFSDRALVRAQLVENMIRLDVQSEERRFERVNQQYLSGSFREADQSESLGVVWSRGNFNIKISRSKSGKAFLVQANSPEFRRVYREMILRLKQNSKNVAALSVPLPYKEGTLSTEELHHLEEAILRALWGDPLTFDQAQKQLKEDIQIKFYFKNDPSLRRGKLAEKITGEMRERGVKKVNVLVRKREGKVYGISEDVYIVARGDAKAIAILASRWAHQGSPGLEAMLADINRIDPDALTRLGQERSVAATARSLEENFEKERLTKVLAQTAM